MYIHPEKDEEISNPTVLFSSRMLEGFSENQMRAKPLGKLHFAVEAERNKNKRAKWILLKYKRSVLHTRFLTH